MKLTITENGGETINLTVSEPGGDVDLSNYYTKSEVDALLLPLATSIGTTGTLEIAFDRASGREYAITGDNAPTGNITFAESGTTKTVNTIEIDKNASFTVSFPSSWEAIGTVTLTNGSRHLITVFKVGAKTFYQLLDTYDIPDETAPTFTDLSVTGTTATGTTAAATINEDATVYYALYSSASDPSKEDIVAGTGVVAFGTILVVEDVEGTDGVTGLTAETTYYLYAYAEDDSGNESDVQAVVGFTTPAAEPKVQLVSLDASDNATITTVDGSVELITNAHGANATQATAARQPTHSDTNDKIVHSQASNQFLTLGDVEDLRFQKEDDFSLVVRNFRISANGYLFSFAIENGDGLRILGSSADSGSIRFVMTGSGTTAVCFFNNSGAGALDNTLRDFIFIHENNTLKIYDGSNSLITTADTSGIGVVDYTGEEAVIGQETVAAGNIPRALDGAWEKIEVFDYALDEAERTAALS